MYLIIHMHYTMGHLPFTQAGGNLFTFLSMAALMYKQI